MNELGQNRAGTGREFGDLRAAEEEPPVEGGEAEGCLGDEGHVL